MEAGLTHKNPAIIRSEAMGSNYRRISLSTLGAMHHAYRPGQYALVDGRPIVIAGSSPGSLDFIVRNDAFIFDSPTETIEYPRGPGFMYIDAHDVICLAGGSGIGAFTGLVSHRASLGLPTLIQMYARGTTKSDVVKQFPQLDTGDFGCWDTSFWGRPRPDTEIVPSLTQRHVLYAGPAGLLRDIQAVPGCPTINLNY